MRREPAVQGEPEPAPLEAPCNPLDELFTRSLDTEHGFEPLAVEGALPPGLRGTLYRNGPGLFELLGVDYRHSFEGDGAITAIRFGETVRGAVRVTASGGLERERRVGRILHGPGACWWRRLGQGLTGGKIKNTANTSVLAWQGRLFALLEAARPTEIDPHELATLGESDLDGVVVSTFCAHPHRVAARRTTYSFGIEYGRRSLLHLYALPDAGPARRLGAVELPYPPMIHDFMATDTHLVFFVSPVRVRVPRLIFSWGEFTDYYQWRPERGTLVLCVPIDDPEKVVRFEVDSFFQWHFANAFSHGNNLVIDYFRYPDFSSFQSLRCKMAQTRQIGVATLHRAVVDTIRGELRTEPLSDVPGEFPRLNPAVEGRRYRHLWFALRDLGGIGRLDVRTGKVASFALPPHQRVTEPVFAPTAGSSNGRVDPELEGHVLALVYDGAVSRSFLAVFDARRLEAGPVARVWFSHHIPMTFHGTWVPSAG